jgi:G3E family GTPase
VWDEAVEQIAFRPGGAQQDRPGEPGRGRGDHPRDQDDNGHVAVLPAVCCDVDLAEIFDVGAFDLNAILIAEPDFLDPDGEHQHDQSVTSVEIDATGAVDVPRLNTWLGALLATRGPDLFAAKGVINLADSDRRYVIQGVHMLHDGDLGAPCGPA